MNESVKRMKKGIIKLTCMTMLTTLCTGYGSVFADTGENTGESGKELLELKKSAKENFDKVSEMMLMELRRANDDLNKSERMLVEGITDEEKLRDIEELMRGNIAAYITRGTETDENGKERRLLKIFVGTDSQKGENIQIWALKGGKHVLIKDYGVKLKDSLDGDNFWGLYRWYLDGESNAKKNIFKRNDESTLREYADNMDDIGIYIKKLDGNEVATYYKKVSNLQDRAKKDAYLITSYDTNLIENGRMSIINAKEYYNKGDAQKLNSAYNTQFPAIAQVGVKFQMCMIKEYSMCHNNKDYNYDIYIEGDNGYREIIVVNTNEFSNEIYKWIPRFDGIFNIVVKESKTKEIISVRKVFVRKSQGNTDYLGIDGMNVYSDDNGVRIDVGVKNFKRGDNKSQVALKIGEDSVWSKHLKEFDAGVDDYAFLREIYDYNSTTGSAIKLPQFNSITTGSAINMFQFNSQNSQSGIKKFELGSGKYLFTAMVKNKKSIEYEDMAARVFSVGEEEELFELEYEANSEFDEANVTNKHKKLRDDSQTNSEYISENINRKEYKYTFRLKPKDPNLNVENYRFAFLLWDARGKRVIVKETTSMEFDYYFRDPGQYKVYFRVRKADGKDINNQDYDGITKLKLKNSYIEEHVQDIFIEMNNDNQIKINTVKVETFDTKGGTNQYFTGEDSSEVSEDDEFVTLKSHSKNLIYIDADYDKGPVESEEGRLMYKVYAIHDGAWECLTPYTASAVIPFYPRSTGDYKLLVLVKDSISGSEEAKMYIDAIAED